jgi:lysophospholipase L1-like esterase
MNKNPTPPTLNGRIALLTLTALLGGLAAAAADPPPAFALHDGDRVVFYGDSITSDGGYARFVEEYCRSRYPRWSLRFYNAGVGGDTVNGGGLGDIGVRLERDVISLKPTVVTIMLGMNDGRYRLLDTATRDAFVSGYRSIVSRLKEALPGVRLYLIRSSPYDDISRPPDFSPGYDETLRQLGDCVASIGLEQHVPVVDFGTAVDEGIRKVLVEDRVLANLILNDRVHPGSSGHMVMGATLLRAWNAPALVARVEIDGASGAVVAAENATVSDLTTGDGKVAWSELDGSLPLPVKYDDGDTQLAQLALARLDSLDSEPLVVTGLRPGRYHLQIDDYSVGDFTESELAGGVNLALLNTPMRRQAYRVLWGADSGHQEQKVRRELMAASPGGPELSAAAAALAAREESEQAARSRSAVPAAHHYALAPAP